MNTIFFEEHFKNGTLMACMAVDLKYIAFVLKDNARNKESIEIDSLPTRLIVYSPAKNEPGSFGVRKWDHSAPGLKVSAKGDDWIVCDENFQIDEVLKKTNWCPIPNNQKGHLAKGMVNIDGDVYAYGIIRSIFKYIRARQWENITDKEVHSNLFIDVETSKERMVGGWVGFNAVDGFDESDIYAGGNKGDFWHYNGNKWTRKELPLNSDISSIACTSTGQTYIGCRIGPVLAGRNDQWEIIDDAKQITHIAWFKGRVYFVDKLGRIYTHNDGDNNLTEAIFKTPLPDHMRHLIKGISSCKECLVAYTEEQAYAYDGEIWHEIIEIPSLSKNK